MPKRILVTGGAGFIGSALVRRLVSSGKYDVLNIDKLTYAGSLATIESVMSNQQHQFIRGDICDADKLRGLFASFRPNIVTHLAAESHVDRSIDGPAPFMETNIMGTYTLLEEVRAYFYNLDGVEKDEFRFHHISTDEVYGSLGRDGFFTENTAYDPRSPYSASKASSDHLVRAWGHTFGLPVIVTNCSNNYGPYQFPEKLIPLMIAQALSGNAMPVYGKGEQIRDWLFVNDHVRALQYVFERGAPGRTYNIGGCNERRNIDVVRSLCCCLDEKRPRDDGRSYTEQITFVNDRPGHDMRYAIDSSRIHEELGWAPAETFKSGLEKTVDWYLKNENWWKPLTGAFGKIARRGFNK